MKRLILTTALASIVVASLSACVPFGGSARDAAAAFLDALHAGDAAAAIALTTADRSDFACELEPGIAGDELGDVVENGDTALAKVTYAVFGEYTSESLELVREGTGWKVVPPDSYRLEIPVESDVVVEATVEDDCVVRPVDGVLELLALPGYYSVVLRDPTEVFSVSALGFGAVPVDGTVHWIEGDEEFISQQDRDIVANLLQVDINAAIEDCIRSGFAGSSCPDDLPVADESQSLDRWFELVSGDPRAVDISSADGERWSFTTDTQTLRIQTNGVLTDVPFSYSGTVTVSDAGDLVPVFD